MSSKCVIDTLWPIQSQSSDYKTYASLRTLLWNLPILDITTYFFESRRIRNTCIICYSVLQIFKLIPNLHSFTYSNLSMEIFNITKLFNQIYLLIYFQLVSFFIYNEQYFLHVRMSLKFNFVWSWTITFSRIRISNENYI